MADRTVTVKLELDIASYLANLKVAQEATKNFGDGTSKETSKAKDETKKLGDEVEEVGKKSDNTSKKVQGNNRADQHSYEQTRGSVLAITALLTNLPAIVAPALGLLLAVPGAIALAGVAAVTTKIGITGLGDALKGLDSNDVTKISKAMTDLSPAAQAFAREVASVHEEWSGLRQAVQQQMFEPVLGSLNDLTTKVLPMLNAELPEVGRSIGNVAAGFADWLGQSDTVGEIARLLENVRTQIDHLVPFLSAWGKAFLDVSNVAGPFLVKLIDMLTSVGQRFDAFINAARNTGQLDTLFKTTAVGVQGLLDLLAKLSDALFTVLSSPGTLSAARVLYGALNALATVIDDLAKAFTLLPGPLQAVVLLAIALAGMGPLLVKGFSAVKTLFIEIADQAGKFAASFKSAATATDDLGNSITATGRASNVASKAMSGFVGVFGGPWGLAITAAVIGLGLLVNNLGAQKAKADQAAQAYLDFGQAVADARAKGTDNVPDLIRQDKAIQDLILDTNKYGVSAKDVVDALSGQKPALDSVKSGLMDYRAQLLGARDAAERVTATDQVSIAVKADNVKQIQKQIDGIDSLIGTLDKNAAMHARASQAIALYNAEASKQGAVLGDNDGKIVALTALYDVLNSKTATTTQINEAFSKTIKSISDSAGPAADTISTLTGTMAGFGGVALTGADRAALYKQVLGGVVDVAAPAKDKVDALSQVFWNVADSELSAGQKADLLKQAWEALYKPETDVTNATQDFNLSLNTLTDQLDKGSRSLNINETAGIKNRQAVEDLIDKNNALYFANIAAGMSAEDAAKKHEENGRKIEDAGHKAGLTTGDVHGLNQEYGRIPDRVETRIQATGVDAVLEQLRVLKIAQYALDNNVSTPAATSAIAGQSTLFNQQVPFAARRASGGYLDGPGTKTSDSIPLWASKGEFVQQASAVDYYGIGLMDALNLRKIPREMLKHMQHLAGGGQVWPFPVNTKGTKMPFTLDELKQKYAPFGAPVAGGNLGAWIAQAIALTHVPATWAGPLSVLVMRESGGNPNSINTTDINAQRGDPSRGLAQTIGATFSAYHWPGTSFNIFDPVANLAAAINYILHRYGSIFNVQQANPNLPPRGYSTGGLVLPVQSFDTGGYLDPGLTLAYNGTGSREPVGAAAGRGDVNINLTVTAPVGASGIDIGRQVIDVIKKYERVNGTLWRN